MPRAFQRLAAPDVSAWLAAHPHALVLDARDVVHHAQAHWPGSLRLDGRNHERLLVSEDKTRPVFIYCYHGHASQTYAEMFCDFGFLHVCDLIGGWEAWSPSGIEAVFDAPAVEASHGPGSAPQWLQAEGFADPHAPGEHGNTPLMHAAWRGQAEVVNWLLDQNVSLDAVNADGNNALWLGCVSNQASLVQRLVEAGVPIDCTNFTGATCLMYAASSSKPEMVQLLLALGADPHIQTQDGFTAMDMAGNWPCLQLLRAAMRKALPASRLEPEVL